VLPAMRGLGALGRPLVSPSISVSICGSSRGDIGGNPSKMITAFSVLRRASSSSMTDKIASGAVVTVNLPRLQASNYLFKATHHEPPANFDHRKGIIHRCAGGAGLHCEFLQAAAGGFCFNRHTSLSFQLPKVRPISCA
jgi:hypothetical protein